MKRIAISMMVYYILLFNLLAQTSFAMDNLLANYMHSCRCEYGLG